MCQLDKMHTTVAAGGRVALQENRQQETDSAGRMLRQQVSAVSLTR
jgi:hypothetical protein